MHGPHFKALLLSVFLQLYMSSISSTNAQNVVISPEGPTVVREGESLNVTCTDRTSFANGNALAIDRNMLRDTTIPGESDGAERTFFIGPISLSDNGTAFRCRHLLEADLSADLVLLVVGEIESSAAVYSYCAGMYLCSCYHKCV